MKLESDPLITAVSSLLVTLAAVGLSALCPKVGGVPLWPESADDGSGLSSPGRATCDHLRTSINFLSFFPCLNDSTFVAAKDCDVFAYPAALLAAEHINSHPRILKFPELGFNTSLRLVEIGTMGNVALSSYLFSESLNFFTRERIHAVVGPASSAVTEVIAYIAGRRYQLHQVSYGATDPSLISSRGRYPLLFSTIPTNEFVNVGRLHLLEMFRWSKCGVIFSEDPVYARIAENFVDLANSLPNVKVAFYGGFSVSPEFAVREIYPLDVRIIFGTFGESQARSALCQAKYYRDGRLTDSNHVWILPSYYDPDWWKLNESEIEKLPFKDRCSNEEMEDILSSTLFINTVNYNKHGTTILNTEKVLSSFYNQLFDKTLETFPSLERENLVPYLPHSHAATAYDAVWSLALAWNEAIPVLFSDMNVCNFETKEEVQNGIKEVLNNSLKAISLNGISGTHRFNTSQDSEGQVLISQFIGATRQPIGTFQQNGMDEGGKFQEHFMYLNITNCNGLEMFYNSTNLFQWEGRPDNTAPSDGLEVIFSVIPISSLCVAGSLILTSMLLAIILLIINVALRKRSYMKATSPKLNLVIIVGFILIMPSSIAVGLSFSRYAYEISRAAANTVCQLHIWLTNIGCTMAFSTLLMKNWRVYKIFHNSNLQRRRNISDNQLFVLIILLVVPMATILTVWVVVDPLYSHEDAIRKGTNLILNVTFCSSEHHNIWRGAYISYTSSIIVALVVFSFLNQRIASKFKTSRIAARFVEEGSSTARVTLVSIFIFAVLYAVVFASGNDPLQYTTVFWVDLCWSLLLPLLLLFVIYLPKFLSVKIERRETKTRRLEHQHFSRIRVEMNLRDTTILKKKLQTMSSDLVYYNSEAMNTFNESKREKVALETCF